MDMSYCGGLWVVGWSCKANVGFPRVWEVERVWLVKVEEVMSVEEIYERCEQGGNKIFRVVDGSSDESALPRQSHPQSYPSFSLSIYQLSISWREEPVV